MKEKIIDTIKKSSIFLLIVMTLIITITSILFVVKVKVTAFHLPIIYIISILVFMIFYRKQNWKTNLISVIVASLIFMISTIAFTYVFDVTSDGNTYHKLAVGSMKNGWNPVYESSRDFTTEKGNVFDPLEENINPKWVDHYAKGTEIFGAVIYAFTNNIESGKIFTIIFAYIVFGIFFEYLAKRKKLNTIISFILSALLAINPITLVQMGNYYVDASLGLMIFLILYCMIVQCDESDNVDKKEIFLILACSIIWSINIKFTGLAYAGVFCAIFYFYLLYKKFRKGKKEFWKEFRLQTIFYVVTLVIAIGIIGYSSYVKNMIFFGHPLYPLYGKDAVKNIGVVEAPKYFENKTKLETFLISIFSKGVNVSASWKTEDVVLPELKVPFTFTKAEVENYNIPDIRMSGFGPLFSGIFILSTIGTIYIIVDLIRKKKFNILVPYLLILGAMGLIILLFDGNYWARYIAFLYMTPFFVLYYLFKDIKNKLKFILGLILTIVIILNTLLIAKVTLSNFISSRKYIRNNLWEFKQYCEQNEDVEINLVDPGFQSVFYNFEDWDIKNYRVNLDKETENDIYFSSY